MKNHMIQEDPLRDPAIDLWFGLRDSAAHITDGLTQPCRSPSPMLTHITTHMSAERDYITTSSQATLEGSVRGKWSDGDTGAYPNLMMDACGSTPTTLARVLTQSPLSSPTNICAFILACSDQNNVNPQRPSDRFAEMPNEEQMTISSSLVECRLRPCSTFMYGYELVVLIVALLGVRLFLVCFIPTASNNSKTFTDIAYRAEFGH